MKLSTKARYGLKACFILCLHESAPVAVAEISRVCAVSEKYLEQLFASLKKAGIVSSIRGNKGGYILTKKPEEIAVGEVLNALEGELRLTDCETGCNDKYCPNRNLFSKLQKDLDAVLFSTTLQDMVNDYKCTDNKKAREEQQ